MKRLNLAKGTPGKRLPKSITYHGRKGRPVVHAAKAGRKYIMVRKKGGGVRRLYQGSLYSTKRTKRAKA